MADMTSSMASLALDDGEEELLQVDDVPSLQIISFANCLELRMMASIVGFPLLICQMGFSSEDNLMDQSECNKRVRTQELVTVVSNRTDSADSPISSSSAGLQERARRVQ
ncbi:hypothetical protein V6N13_016078 [Hibiscus sabdariffa]